MNFTFVVLLVVLGLTIVLAIPYFLLQRKPKPNGRGDRKGKDGGSIISSLTDVSGARGWASRHAWLKDAWRRAFEHSPCDAHPLGSVVLSTEAATVRTQVIWASRDN
jgi:hypothetical protein